MEVFDNDEGGNDDDDDEKKELNQEEQEFKSPLNGDEGSKGINNL